jgi:hypothetical protein
MPLMTQPGSNFFLIHGERRSPFRPKRGDVRPCPRCGYAMRFEDVDIDAPAWMCRNISCLNAEFVRGNPASADAPP